MVADGWRLLKPKPGKDATIACLPVTALPIAGTRLVACCALALATKLAVTSRHTFHLLRVLPLLHLCRRAPLPLRLRRASSLLLLPLRVPPLPLLFRAALQPLALPSLRRLSRKMATFSPPGSRGRRTCALATSVRGWRVLWPSVRRSAPWRPSLSWPFKSTPGCGSTPRASTACPAP